MPPKQPLVSVIIPVFNARSFLAPCIQSVLGQTYKNIEIIAVEDGPKKHEDIMKSFPSVHYIDQPQAGPATARNRGIQQSKGTYVSFLDCDDIFVPKKIELQVEYLEQHREYDVIAGLTEEFLEPGTTLPAWVRDGAIQGPHNGISPGALTMRRSLFTRVGLFNTSFIIGSDMEWILRLKKHSIPIASLPTTVLRKRIHSSNQSSHGSPKEMAQYRKELLSIFRP